MSLPYRNRKKRRRTSYILIGDGFDELEVVYMLHKFRGAGLHIKSVSLRDRLVFSHQGVGLQADYELGNQPIDPSKDFLLILPTGGHNETILRRDARVKSLLKSLDTGEGSVAITNSQSALVEDLSDLMRNGPIYQPYAGQDLEDFVDSLTSQVH